jgi:hypothetical protein
MSFQILPDGVRVERLAFGFDPVELGVELDVLRRLLQLVLVLYHFDTGVHERVVDGLQLGAVRRLGFVLEQVFDVLFANVALHLALLEQLLESGHGGMRQHCARRPLPPAIPPRAARPCRVAGFCGHGVHSSYAVSVAALRCAATSHNLSLSGDDRGATDPAAEHGRSAHSP